MEVTGTMDVIVIGAGPVGLTLALDLASQGISVTVFERRFAGELPSVRCNHVSARSMEHFRRLGIAEEVRNAGLPADYPQDVSYRITTVGPELARIRIPSRADRFTERDDGPDSWWPTPEPPHRINQIYLEPILARTAAANPLITIHYRAELRDLTQDGAGVTATMHDLDSGSNFALRAPFLVGCDGGRSTVRKQIGATLVGDAIIQRVQSTDIRAPGLLDQLAAEPAWAMFSLNPQRSGNVYSIDGRERFLVHNYLRDDEPDFNAVDRDQSIRQILGVGPDFQYQIVANEDWFGRRLVADKMRDGRVFICGDAAHLWVPYAGYGMNAGIADAGNLAWLLAAHLGGWGRYEILDAYEAERHPITEQVSRFAMDHCIAMAKQRGAVPQELEEQSPAGRAARERLGREAYDLNVQQYCCAGLNFGYFYDQSPLIVYDGEKQPSYAMAEYHPSTVPGCRMPHLWLRDGRSLYDILGSGYAFLRFDPAADLRELEAAADAAGMPFCTVDVESDDEWLQVVNHAIIVVRPDRHVAWRGDVALDAEALVDRLRGAGPGVVQVRLTSPTADLGMALDAAGSGTGV